MTYASPKIGLKGVSRAVGVLLATIALTAGAVCADTALWDLSTGNFSQDWSNAGLITANDNWAAVPSIVGYIGDVYPSTSPTNEDPQLWLDPNMGAVDVIANQTNPNTLTNGGVAEFDTLADPTVAIQGSGTADKPGLVLFMNSTNRVNVTIRYNLRDIDGAADNAVQQVALQWRVGGSGNFVNVPSAYVADASTGPSLATLVTPVSVSLPAWDNKPMLEFRILTTNAGGSDEWIGIDDISVTSAVPEPGSLMALAAGALTILAGARRRK